MLFGMLAKAAKAAHRPNDDEFRADCTIDALGGSKSWTKLTQRDIDRLKAHLTAIFDPSNLNAQIDADNQPTIRAIATILSYGLDEPYLAALGRIYDQATPWRSLPLEILKGPMLYTTARATHRLKRRKKLDPQPLTDAELYDLVEIHNAPRKIPQTAANLPVLPSDSPIRRSTPENAKSSP